MQSSDEVIEALEALAHAPDVVVPLVREVPPAILKRRPAPSRWSAHEHACHLAHVHALFFDRFRHVALHDFLHGYRIEELLLRPDRDAGVGERAPRSVR